MALSDFDIVTVDVPLPNGKSFTVRGLSLVDIAPLISRRRPQLEAFFVKFSDKAKKSGKSEEGAVVNVALDLISIAPELAAEIIAGAADEPTMLERALKLPMPVQMDALSKIATLTFDAAGGPGKFFEALGLVLSGTSDVMTGLNRSRTGS